MKISIVGPSNPIPPLGWGAVESLIWDYKVTLDDLGHEVGIFNSHDPNQILADINSFNPDFVHINYDDWIVLYPHIKYPCACTTHYAYLEQQDKLGGYSNFLNLFRQYKPNIFGLSQGILDMYENNCNISKEKLFLNPNGVNLKLFNKLDKPSYPDRSIYLAKIDYRKRQHLFQSIDSLWYAGNIADSRFDQTKNYLGEWTKPELYDKLTQYGNLILLSDGEAHPLVCMEAFASGLGVVVCEWGAANLDNTKEFIDIVPENKINDIEYVQSIITKNREYSASHRDEIYEYSKTFEWKNVLEKHFLPSVDRVISSF
jgi:hypothetical protein